MKSTQQLLLLSLVFISWLSHSYSQSSEQLMAEAKQCQQSLQSNKQAVNKLAGCKQLVKASSKGNTQADLKLGLALVYSKHITDKQKRIRRGLYLLITVADTGDKAAIHAISQFVKTKMQDGKMPIRYAHLAEYIEQDWQRQGQPAEHHFKDYQHWLNQVEQSQENPKQLSAEQLVNIAIDYQNGYFLGQQPQIALKLFQLAAEQGNSTAQFKTGELLYPDDRAKALDYLTQAANNQSSDAMLMLGDHYGCQGNKQQALTWYQKAIVAGNDYAEDEKQTLLETGKPTQCD